MENSIGVGAIVGLTTVSSIYVWNTDSFSKVQKTILLFCIIFPPAQWVGILIFLIYNDYTSNNTQEKINEKKIVENQTKLDSSIQNLKELKDKGILSDIEYRDKVNKIEEEKVNQGIKASVEYNQLKSLLDSNVLTKNEFEDKVEILRSIKSTVPNTANSTPRLNLEIVSVWHKLTNFDKNLGKYITYEIHSDNIKLDKLTFNKKFSEESYFIINKLEMGFFNSAEELIFNLTNIKVSVK